MSEFLTQWERPTPAMTWTNALAVGLPGREASQIEELLYSCKIPVFNALHVPSQGGDRIYLGGHSQGGNTGEIYLDGDRSRVMFIVDEDSMHIGAPELRDALFFTERLAGLYPGSRAELVLPKVAAQLADKENILDFSDVVDTVGDRYTFVLPR